MQVLKTAAVSYVAVDDEAEISNLAACMSDWPHPPSRSISDRSRPSNLNSSTRPSRIVLTDYDEAVASC